MTHETTNRLVVTGFAMVYLGTMGLLLMLSSVNLSEDMLRAVRIALAAAVGVGAALTLIGRLAPHRDS